MAEYSVSGPFVVFKTKVGVNCLYSFLVTVKLEVLIRKTVVNKGGCGVFLKQLLKLPNSFF